MSAFLSIVVPVYNVAEYLASCVSSALAQDCGDIELILVDDGSSDGCAALCDKLALRDRERVRVIHKRNGGLADARNEGIALASAEYIAFLDADDFYFGGGCLARMISLLRRDIPDMLLFNYARFREGSPVSAGLINFPDVFFEGAAPGADSAAPPLSSSPPAGSPREAVTADDAFFSSPLPPYPAAPQEAERASLSRALKLTAAEGFCALVRAGAYRSSACFRAVRRELLEAPSPLRFEKGALSEDIEFSAALMKRAASVEVFDETLYGYRVRESSITKSVSAAHADDLIKIIGRLAADDDVPEGLEEAYRGYAAFQFCTLLINARLANERSRRELGASKKELPERGEYAAQKQALAERRRAVELQIKELSPLLKYAADSRSRAIKLCRSLLGLRATGALLTLYFKLFCK